MTQLTLNEPSLRKQTLQFTLLVQDSIAFIFSSFSGFTSYLNQNDYVNIGSWYYCRVANAILLASTLCSTLFILSMTFGRFYSIIQPHKAASFNTFKKAKITICGIVLFSFSYNFPHFIFTLQDGKKCVPYGKALDYAIGQFYYWFSTVISFFIPFVLLLIMNSVIIHTLRKRSSSNLTRSDTAHQGQGQGQGQTERESTKIKSSETQIDVILLLITFGFLILTTPNYAMFLYAILYDFEQSPNYAMFLYAILYDFEQSPRAFAGYHLFYNVLRQTYYTNHAINFYLYVISGQKFRTDLVKLFQCTESKPRGNCSVSDGSSKISVISV